jgi:hypothetical protein
MAQKAANQAKWLRRAKKKLKNTQTHKTPPKQTPLTLSMQALKLPLTHSMQALSLR